MNAVLNGTQDFLPDYGKPPINQKHTRTNGMTHTSSTVVLLEPAGNVPAATPALNSSTGVDRERHFDTGSHMVFVDTHVQMIIGDSLPQFAQFPDGVMPTAVDVKP